LIKGFFTKHNKIELVLAVIVFGLAFGAYLKTLCPTVYLGDSGELIAAVYTLGIPHPTGYPLYCLLGKLFAFIPLGDIAYRVNLMSAFFAASTAVLLYFIMRLLRSSRIVSLSTGLMLAFSYTFWSQAVIAEVYTLNAFFTAAIILILFTWMEKKDDRLLCLLALVYGLSLTHHRSTLMMSPAILYLILSSNLRIIFDWRRLLAMLGYFILGLAFYLYLPLRILARPVMNWQTISSWGGLWFHLKGAQYNSFFFAFSWQELWHNFLAYLRGLSEQFTVYLLPFALVGLIAALKKSSKILVFLLLIALLNILFVINYGVSDIEVFRLPSFIVIVLFIGLGFGWISNRYMKSRLIKVLLVLSLALIVFLSNYRENDRSQYYFAYDYGMNILKTMEPNAIFIPSGDFELFSVTYLKVVEGIRSDVSVYDEYGCVALPASLESRSANKITQAGLAARFFLNPQYDVYFTKYQNLEFFPDLRLEPQGLLFKLVRKGERKVKRKDYWADYEFRGWRDPKIFKDRAARICLFNYYQMLYVSRDLEKVGRQLREEMGEVSDDLEHTQLFFGQYLFDQGLLDEAREKFRKSLEINSSLLAAHLGLARIALRRKDYQQAIIHCNNAIRFFPGEFDAYVCRGEAYEDLGKLDLAEKDYLRAYWLVPHNFLPRIKLGKLYLSRGESKKAAQQFEKILELNPKHAEARKLLKKAQVSSAD